MLKRPRAANIHRAGSLTVKYLHTPPRKLAASVLEATAAEMKLAVHSLVPPNTRVELKLDSGEVVAGNVRYCRQMGEEEYYIGVRRAGVDQVLERRKEPRYPTGGAAEIRIIGETATPHLHGTVCDVSRGGLGLNVKEPLPPGTAVELTFQESTATGIVRNCHPRSSGFRIGLALMALEPCRQLRAEPRTIPILTPFLDNLVRMRQWVVRVIRLRTPRES